MLKRTEYLCFSQEWQLSSRYKELSSYGYEFTKQAVFIKKFLKFVVLFRKQNV